MEHHLIEVHVYADDIKLYTACNTTSDFSVLEKCLEETKEWAGRNYLKWNDNKT